MFAGLVWLLILAPEAIGRGFATVVDSGIDQIPGALSCRFSFVGALMRSVS